MIRKECWSYQYWYIISYIHSLLLCDQYRIHYNDILNWNDSSFTVKCQYRFICAHVVVNIYFSEKNEKLLFLQRKCYMLFDICDKFISEPLQSSKQFTFSAHYIFSHSLFYSMHHNIPLSLAAIYVVETSTFATKIYISDRCTKQITYKRCSYMNIVL